MTAAGSRIAEPGALAAHALSDEQEHPVARRREPLLLAAGAGSGKTSVLVERFVRAVRDDRIAPAQILAITFTDRAAGELRARVRRRLIELGEREAARDTEAAFVGTFHSFCARLLRTHTRLAGLDPDFAILDEGLSARLRRRAFDVALRELIAGGSRRDALELVAAFRADELAASVPAVYLALRSRGARAPRLPDASARAREGSELDARAVPACRLLDELLGRFGEAFEQLKLTRAGVDFDDLELLAAELLNTNSAVRRAWSERFEMLMVDEFQDTNPRQLSILAALERDNLFTVGDEQQAIYGFRHADVSLFRSRREELAAAGGALALRSNFRSSPPLLAVVNAVFSRLIDRYQPLLPGRADGDLRRDGGDRQAPAARERGAGRQLSLPGTFAGECESEPAVELLLTSLDGWDADADLERSLRAGMPDAPRWRLAEAHLLGERIASLLAGGRAQAGEIAVLLRAGGDLAVYERALALRGVRTLPMVGGFWRAQQVLDVLGCLAALANPLDELALYSALASPLGGCPPDVLALLSASARGRGVSAWEAARAGDAGERAKGFCEWLAAERAHAAQRPLAELIERAIRACSYREHVSSLDGGELRLANIHKLMRLASRFEATEGRDLRGFLDHAAQMREGLARPEPDAPIAGDERDAVRLMSIHAAKGLEFPVVFVADLGRAPGGRAASLLVDGPRVGLRLVGLDGEKAAPTLDYDELHAEHARAEAQEETRVFYVAMTRARELLVLSGGIDYQRWPRPRDGTPAIAWLGPAIDPELPRLAAEPRGSEPLDLAAGEGTVRCRFSSPAHAAQLLGLPARAPGAEKSPPGLPPEDADPPAPPEAAGPAPGGPPGDGPPPGAGSASPAETPGPSREREEPCERPISVPSLSYTSLTELERCGYRYYLERVLGMSEAHEPARAPQGAEGAEGDGAGGLEARVRGTLVHRVLEQLGLGRAGDVSPGQVADTGRELGVRASEREAAEIARMIRAAGGTPLAARAVAASELRVEHPFSFAIAPDLPLVSGLLDAVAIEPDGAALVLDYKSDRLPQGADVEAIVGRDYGVQRLLYAIAMLRAGSRSVEVVHWFLERPTEWASASYGAGELQALAELAAGRVRAALSRGYAVSERPHRGLCLTCPGRGGLCSWGERETLRETPSG